MGTGSFGGGSGSFGGSSGGGGGGGAGASSGTDSAHDRILRMSKLTESFNKNPEIGKVRALIYGLLRDRVRSDFLRVTLSDAMVVSAYKALLSFEADLRGGATTAGAASKFVGSAGATLADLANVICQRGQAADTDERTERIVQRAVTHLLLQAVGNKHDQYYEMPIGSLGGKFNVEPLENTADSFLGTLICEATRPDLFALSDKAREAIGDASREIALSWTDKFKDRSRNNGVRFRDMLQTISENYTAYAEGKA